MNEQHVINDFQLQSAEEYINSFEPSQSENESEEDIRNIDGLSYSDLAITGTDWTVETIINQIKKGNIQLDPSFQRRDAWSNKVKSKFIESLFMGLPIPQIILAEQKDKKGKFIVIDGKQRLLSLKQFALPEKDNNALKLSGLEVLSKFNRMTYADIENGLCFDDIDAFNNQTIRTVVIKNWKNVEVLYLLFLRLNTGSVKLSPQELRQALYPGQFIDFVNAESSQNQYLQKMLNIKRADFRMRDVEILIRYFVSVKIRNPSHRRKDEPAFQQARPFSLTGISILSGTLPVHCRESVSLPRPDQSGTGSAPAPAPRADSGTDPIGFL